MQELPVRSGGIGAMPVTMPRDDPGCRYAFYFGEARCSQAGFKRYLVFSCRGQFRPEDLNGMIVEVLDLAGMSCPADPETFGLGRYQCEVLTSGITVVGGGDPGGIVAEIAGSMGSQPRPGVMPVRARAAGSVDGFDDRIVWFGENYGCIQSLTKYEYYLANEVWRQLVCGQSEAMRRRGEQRPDPFGEFRRHGWRLGVPFRDR